MENKSLSAGGELPVKIRSAATACSDAIGVPAMIETVSVDGPTKAFSAAPPPPK